jgi:hypothetical protein
VADSSKHGNESSAYTRGEEFLDRISVLLASQGGLCCMKLVS